MQHKWHKEIKAWADGAEIEVKNKNDTNKWETIIKNPMWYTEDWWEYRIKPQPKEPQYLYAWLDKGDENIQWTYDKPTSIKEDDLYKYIGKVKLEVDD
jgi:hypothetical protein